ncbi:hypothetical protein EC900091_2021, partial [Escherichia coli 90.0091]
ELHNPAESKT